MDIKLVSEIQETNKNATVLIPIIPGKEQIESLADEYALAGIRSLQNQLKNTEGKYAVSYQSEGGTRTVIIWNIKNSTQAATNKNALELSVKNKNLLSGEVLADFSYLDKSTTIDRVAPALFRGLFLSGYSVGKYKKSNDESSAALELVSIRCAEKNSAQLESCAQRALQEAETIRNIMTLVNEPSNHKAPSDLANYFVRAGNRFGFDVDILSHENLEEQNFHALLAVNRGSEQPACCLVGKYLKGGEDSPLVALVGKGVTFDTGGLSIKPSQNMHYMKSDMGGAAAVMGAIEIVSRLELPVNLVVVVPCTDNSVDKLAIKPGDVINSLKGSTIEVIDTDAEGRLILADGLHYAINEFNPDYLVNLATLTGSVVRTLGSYAAGLMTKNSDLSEQLVEAGEKSGDRVWPLPLWDDYDQLMQSDIADIRNLSSKPVAGAITAGKFLEHFTDGHQKWAHLDIAGTAFGASPFSKGYSATGFGILLLLSWIENL